MDLKAFYQVTYGLYVVSAAHGGRRGGCVINTFQQVTSQPVRVAVTVNKNNFTAELIEKAGRYVVTVMAQDVDSGVIGTFGFRSGRDVDKFAGYPYEEADGIPYLTKDMTAVFVCRVFDKVDLGTHICFYAEVEDCRTLSGQPVLTYGYYQTVKKGTTPKNAPSYKGGEDIKMAKIYYRCKVCGHVENVSELPEGYVCPVCGVGPEMFERVEEPEAAAVPAAEAKGYRCKVCGYVEHLAELPADYVCPVCGVGPEMFEKL